MRAEESCHSIHRISFDTDFLAGGEPGEQGSRSAEDLEKNTPVGTTQTRDGPPPDKHHNSQLKNQLGLFWQSFLRDNFEARGIQRVSPDDRHDTRRLGLTQMMLLWISINLAANNITLGMLGPTVYYLPFLDSSLCAVLGILLGSLPVAYIATFGPQSGNRTMVFARYIMGWWPSKLIVVLTLIVLLGYSVIDAVRYDGFQYPP